jgi:ABC-type glycerol-3-phosphate transport system permease component
VTDPGTVRLTLTWQKSSRLRTLVDKYIDSYRWALRYIPFDTQLRNTVILVILNVLGQLFACSLAAYGFARLNFWGRDLLFGLLLATMMLPGQVTMIPTFVLWKWLGWYNTLQPLWVPAWFGGAFFIFLLRQFFMTIPKELEDAAKIDGCGFFGIYWRIMLPLAGPALATVAIFSFMGAWNEFVQPLVYLSDERLFPLSLGLNQFRQEQAAEWSWLMAASTMMMLPVIAVFFFCQRYFIQGITLTGLKG